MNHTRERQRGSVIIYAMLTMSVMLAIGLTLNALFIGKLRSASAARDSMVALYAADSAAELCLIEARSATDQPPITFSMGATYQITDVGSGADVTDNCMALGSASFQFRAVGRYRGTSRALEISQ
ncbi:MAG: hypothetical protein IT406_01890 [Candidatus Yanofskybacteria bacterium]|nr:hypothetical protein [Candidatus Yanofskybacteria bacterium]